jgi:hypothetical protein
MRRRAVLSAIAALPSAGLAPLHAQETRAQRRYAVLSLVGDRLTVVGYMRKVGSAHDTNEQQVVPLNDTVLDADCLRAAEEGLGKADSGAPVSLLFAASRKQYEGHAGFFDGNKAKLPGDILAPMRSTGSTHLVLVTKLRAQASFEFVGGTRTGSGWIEGIGFYIDRVTRTTNAATGQQGLGYLVPYAYMQASLIDLASSEVLRSERILASRLVGASQSEDGANPWEALAPKQKIDVLRGLVRRGVSGAVESIARPA